MARGNGRAQDPSIRQKLMHLHAIGEVARYDAAVAGYGAFALLFPRFDNSAEWKYTLGRDAA